MQCHEFAERLNQVLDERRVPSDDDLLAAHAQDCQLCREALLGHEALLSGLELLESPRISARFAERVVSAVSDGSCAAPVFKAQRRLGPIAALVGLAAAALLVVTLSRDSDPRAVNGPGDQAASQSASKGTARPAKQRAGAVMLSAIHRRPGNQSKLPAAVRPAAGAGESLSNERFLEYRAAIHLFAEHLPEAVEQLDSVETYAPGIRPIRASFSVAIDTLRRTIPGASEPRTGVPQAGSFEPAGLFVS